MENRIDRKFFDLKKKNKKALACFVTSCDPSLELSKKIPLYNEVVSDQYFNYKILSHSRKQISRIEISKIN